MSATMTMSIARERFMASRTCGATAVAGAVPPRPGFRRGLALVQTLDEASEIASRCGDLSIDPLDLDAHAQVLGHILLAPVGALDFHVVPFQKMGLEGGQE